MWFVGMYVLDITQVQSCNAQKLLSSKCVGSGIYDLEIHSFAWPGSTVTCVGCKLQSAYMCMKNYLTCTVPYMWYMCTFQCNVEWLIVTNDICVHREVCWCYKRSDLEIGGTCVDVILCQWKTSECIKMKAEYFTANQAEVF